MGVRTRIWLERVHRLRIATLHWRRVFNHPACPSLLLVEVVNTLERSFDLVHDVLHPSSHLKRPEAEA
jgi:hypothetical protein